MITDKSNFLTMTDLQERLHIGRNTAYKLVKQPDFPKVQIGKKYIIPEDMLGKYLEKHLKHKILID